jgi:hypothetical protein
MHTLTAILRAKPGHEDTVHAALLACGAFVRAHEPDTASFFVTQSSDTDPCVFVTHDLFPYPRAVNWPQGQEGARAPPAPLTTARRGSAPRRSPGWCRW